jgi:DNA polymerase (family 10)
VSRNAEVADRFEEFADLLEAQGVEYKPRAYRRAAENIRDHPEPIEDLAAEGQSAVGEIDGVGDAISAKVVEYIETGSIEELEAAREDLPVDMVALTSVEGIGPKTVGDLYEALGVTDLDDLERAAREGEIQEVSGFGAKTEENILENIPFARQAQERELVGDAKPLAEDVRAFLEAVDAAARVDIAGSLRRWKETIGDVDALAASEDRGAVVAAFTDWARVDDRIEAGDDKASVRVDGVRVDLRVVAPEEFGSALQYFTGSRDHNIRVRNRAIERDLKMNEYGVFDVSGVEDPDSGQRVGERVAGSTEESMYDAVDLPWIPPELREDTGEVAAAEAGDLPDLLAEGEINGDLHTHTDWSDGDNTITEMVAGAAEFGYDYHAVTDHGAGPGVFGNAGLDEAEIREQMAAVEDAREDADIPVLHGIEANIDAEGGVTTDDDVLADLDIVVASPHSALGQGGEEATERIVAAIEHPSVDVIGHPTGRLINDRQGLDLDFERVATAAAEHDTALEINANPHRLDLRAEAVRVAVEAGATVVVNTDAHGPASFALIEYGVHTARRGWAETSDVLNTRDVDGVREFLH